MYKNRLLYIDGIKGLCALIVLISHLNCVLRENVSEIDTFFTYPFLRRLGDGNLSVSVFIILSSFITTYLLYNNKDNVFKIQGNIIIKRYLRLSLPIAAVLIISVALYLSGLYYNQEVLKQQNFTSKWIQMYTQSLDDIPLSILMSPFGTMREWINVLWMIKYVFLGTFLAILLNNALYTVRLKKKILVCIFCSILLYFYDFYYINIVIGFLLFHLLVHPLNRFYRIILFCLFILSIFHGEFIKESYKDNVIVAMGCVGFVVMNSSIQKLFQMKFLMWLGSISLEIFLIQIPIIYSFTCYLILQNQLTLSYVCTIYIATIIIVLLASILLNKTVMPLCKEDFMLFQCISLRFVITVVGTLIVSWTIVRLSDRFRLLKFLY